MKYLIVQDWPNTRGNHAGMEHMCDMLVERWPDTYIKICKSLPLPQKNISNFILRKLFGKLERYYRSIKWDKEYLKLCKPMFENLKSGDEVFLLEYNWPATSQLCIAKYIRKNFAGVKIHALSHITPTAFMKMKADKLIKSWSEYVDTELTLGSSLSVYFEGCGIPRSKISTGFHYVDSTYYYPMKTKYNLNEKPTVIAIGALQRDFKMLADIANSVPETNWIICKGKKDVDHLFHGENIKMVGYVPEDELRELMRQSDISINILEDTVGSNVITTSMAMGLALIVSDVGSIRDYVDEKCAIFCPNNVSDFIEAIKSISEKPDRIEEMRDSALLRVDNITIARIHEWFSSLKNL